MHGSFEGWARELQEKLAKSKEATWEDHEHLTEVAILEIQEAAETMDDPEKVIPRCPICSRLYTEMANREKR